jgi:hypothetical protein
MSKSVGLLAARARNHLPRISIVARCRRPSGRTARKSCANAAGRFRFHRGIALRKVALAMDEKERVVELRAQGLTPKAIARSLGLRLAVVSELVRQIAVEAAERNVGAPAPLAACLVSAGWSLGLGFPGEIEPWRDLDRVSGTAGMAGVLVAREQRYGKVLVGGFLVDVFCLGVKNAIPPVTMTLHELERWIPRYFSLYHDPPVAVPIEVVQSLVLGAVDFARALGFEPHADFERARALLGPWAGPSAIVFGDRGRPHYVSGPNEDPEQVLATLRRTVGHGRFDATLLG